METQPFTMNFTFPKRIHSDIWNRIPKEPGHSTRLSTALNNTLRRMV